MEKGVRLFTLHNHMVAPVYTELPNEPDQRIELWASLYKRPALPLSESGIVKSFVRVCNARFLFLWAAGTTF